MSKRFLTVLGENDKVGFIQSTYKGEAVYGVTWDKTSNALVRTNASVGMVAAAGVDAGVVTNDFDTADIYKDIIDATDADGNEFRGIPKLYIRKTDTPSFKSWQISKAKMPGSYCPYDFYNFSTGTWNDYVYVGKYPAGTTLTGGTKLNSLPNEYPLINKNIVEFRTYAEANGAGYQQLDIHVYDMLQVLFTIEFAALDSQAIMAGWTSGTSNKLATVAELAANRIIVANADADVFAVGQPVGIGTSNYGNQIATYRDITSIDVYDASNKAISFDGAAVDVAIGNIVYNLGWKSGFSSVITASSGSLANNTNGKNPFHYRGIENLYGNVWQFVDGLNINARQAWYCKDADDYASNVFASPYEKLGYVNKDANGYLKYMGFDPANPMVELPVDVSENYYKDYYYQSTAQYIAFVGGDWSNGGSAGLWSWYLNASSALTGVAFGGRLIKKGTI